MEKQTQSNPIYSEPACTEQGRSVEPTCSELACTEQGRSVEPTCSELVEPIANPAVYL